MTHHRAKTCVCVCATLVSSERPLDGFGVGVPDELTADSRTDVLKSGRCLEAGADNGEPATWRGMLVFLFSPERYGPALFGDHQHSIVGRPRQRHVRAEFPLVD